MLTLSFFLVFLVVAKYTVLLFNLHCSPAWQMLLSLVYSVKAEAQRGLCG